MSKKAMEMSVGMIVIIILSVLIFSLSLSLLFKWFGQAEKLQGEIDRQTQDQILQALKTGNQLVVVPFSIQQIKRGDIAIFGIGVRNVGADSDYSMAVEFSNAYNPDGSQLGVDRNHIRTKWVGNFNTVPTFKLKRNQQEVKTLAFKADVNMAPSRPTTRGDYVFNVCVYNKPLDSSGGPFAPCNLGQFKNDPKVFYTQKIYQVTIRVV